MESIQNETENKDEVVVLEPKEYERTDQELKDDPEWIHLDKLRIELGIKI